MRDCLAPVGTWRKSSYSSNEGACVETAKVAEGCAVRDSKDPTGPTLAFPAASWGVFTAGLQTGQFD